MPSRIAKRVAHRKSQGRPTSVVFITAGDPDLPTTERIVLALAKAGVDVVELGIPFSDPMADGPTIQASSQRALRHNVNVPQVLDLVARVRQTSDVPIVLMSYYNPVLQTGLDAFARACSWVGVDGVILTDLTPEEAGPWKQAATTAGIDTVFLVAPTSTDERIALISRIATGFIYCVSRTGVTGARDQLPFEELSSLVSRIRARTKLPIMIGFGISKAEHVSLAAQIADGVVVGSALVDVIAQNQHAPNLPEVVATKAAELFGLNDSS
ncbi:MAG: tryptophan synthase subunit alpha [Armatimonadota bacterium]